MQVERAQGFRKTQSRERIIDLQGNSMSKEFELLVANHQILLSLYETQSRTTLDMLTECNTLQSIQSTDSLSRRRRKKRELPQIQSEKENLENLASLAK